MLAAALERKTTIYTGKCKKSVLRQRSIGGFQMESPNNWVAIPVAENPPDAPFQSWLSRSPQDSFSRRVIRVLLKHQGINDMVFPPALCKQCFTLFE